MTAERSLFVPAAMTRRSIVPIFSIKERSTLEWVNSHAVFKFEYLHAGDTDGVGTWVCDSANGAMDCLESATRQGIRGGKGMEGWGLCGRACAFDYEGIE